eukprot:CAMPEP_0201283156 /NCGR_PEP_ID=MMETSP1317-20130820/7789_1 /ASSEMBLY_ACC=CAM_ASM_000770 /TAXON_ID=187299 /ORGANISM="Undescribed Undescribed, Strain Undescribed" /LENGTH=103 /DNA_ID=CAMNT_0047598437 /DNA_START=223 /DNA_END=534 /DNA_ORIENTATION=-
MGDIDPRVDEDMSFQLLIVGLVNLLFGLDDDFLWTLTTVRHQFGNVDYTLEVGSEELDLNVSPYPIVSASCIPANSWTYDEGPLEKDSDDIHNVPTYLLTTLK